MDADLLTDMATFATVVDHNSFSAAADALNTSKSSVSRRVAALEQRLDLELMQRTTRKLVLTESGRLYYEHCARLLSNAKEADKAIRMMRAVPSGCLNLSVPETLGRAVILPVLPEFLNLYPDINLNLTITSRKVDLIEDRCDIAVRKGLIEDESLTAIPLGSSTQFLYASPAFLDTAPEITAPNDLQNCAYLSSQIDLGPTRVTLWRDLTDIQIQITPRLAVRDHEALLKMTLAGLGVALLPVWMAENHVKKGDLVQLLPEFRGPSVDFNIVYQPHRASSPNVRAFVEFLVTRFQQDRPWTSEGFQT